jgi:hypothetical protein
VDAPLRSYALADSKGAKKHIRQLAKDVPNSPWIVVVDGEVNNFAKGIINIIHDTPTNRTDRIVHVPSSADETFGEPSLNGFRVVALDPKDPVNSDFLSDLPADVVIVAGQDEALLRPRAQRWKRLARFVFAQTSDETEVAGSS